MAILQDDFVLAVLPTRLVSPPQTSQGFDCTEEDVLNFSIVFPQRVMDFHWPSNFAFCADQQC